MTGPSPSSGELVYASCVAIGDDAVLITGPSGSGKSDLALRLIDRGAMLVSDDYTQLSLDEAGGAVLASPPQRIAGKIEVRGLGIVSLPWRSEVPVVLVIALAAEGEPPVERLPFDPEYRTLCGHDIRLLRLSAFEASAPVKLEHMVRICTGSVPALHAGTDL